MKITLVGFKGIAPKFDEEQLVDGYSVVSNNTRPGRVMLEPWRKEVDVANGSFAVNTIVAAMQYSHNADPKKWFVWSNQVYAVKAPLINDAYDEVVIVSEGSDPQVTASDQHGLGAATSGTPATRPLGIPRPPAPTIVSSLDPNPNWTEPPDITPDEYDISYTSYVCAYVDGWGRIGPISEPSPNVEIKEHEFEAATTTTVGITTTMPPIGVARKNPVLRLYRANFTGGNVGDYQFLTDIDLTLGATQFVDDVFTGDLLESPLNEDWVGPPDTNVTLYPNGPLEKIIPVAGEFLAGHNERILCFSEPGATHAWPVEYYKVQQERIVTISTAGANIVVLTDGFPYVVTGVHPSTMSTTRLADQVPCASALGVAEINDAVYYVAENGLYKVDGFRVMNVLGEYMTESEWKALGPSSIRLSTYDDRLFISSELMGITYVLDPQNLMDALRTVSVDPQCVVQLEDTSGLAFIKRGTNKLVEFDAHGTEFMAVDWKSKVYQSPTPVNYACARVRSKSFPVTVSFRCDHSDVHTYTKEVTSDEWFWLDLPHRATKWWVQVSSTAGVTRPEIFNIQLASSPEEVA